MSRPVYVGSLKEGMYIVLDGEPSRIVSIDKSKPGKHGSAKARIVAIGVFDGVKRSIVQPVDAKVEVPIIEKRSGQVIATAGDMIQIMDLETFEVFELTSVEEELKKRLKPTVEIEYWRLMGRPKIVRVKG